MSSALPLTGVTVVAVEQAVAAPFCTARLADAGATVIKIERPEGDFARGYDDVVHGESSYFVWLNRGKRSAASARWCSTLRVRQAATGWERFWRMPISWSKTLSPAPWRSSASAQRRCAPGAPR
jgi:CoA-transferase family III